MSAFNFSFPVAVPTFAVGSGLPVTAYPKYFFDPALAGAAAGGSETDTGGGKGGGVSSGSQQTPQGPAASSAPWWQSVAGIGSGLLNTFLGYNLQKQQISQGQVPSIGYSPVSGAPQGQSTAVQLAAAKTGQVANALSGLSTSTIAILVVALIIAALLFRR